MKKNSVIIVLIIIILGLISYIVYDKFKEKKERNNNDVFEEIRLVDAIFLDYVDIYLTSDGISYISPINKEKIEKLNGDNLKERLNTLYNRAFFYDIYINNHKLKGFKIKLDSEIKSIRKVELDEKIYIIFIKKNNTIGLFDYEEYYNLLNTNIEDNFNGIKNIKDIKNNKIIYLDGSSEDFNKKK